MIAIDTNLLIYAYRADAQNHHAAKVLIEQAANDARGWGIPIYCVGEFFRFVTHPNTPARSSPTHAASFIEALIGSGAARIFYPDHRFVADLVASMKERVVCGNDVFDLQIATCALNQGATTLWTNDKSFAELPGLQVEFPLTP